MIGLALAIIAATVLLAAYVRRRRGAPPPRSVSPAPTAARTANRSAASVRMRWAIPSFALLAIVAVGTPILALVLLRHPKSSPAGRTNVATPYEWAAHQRPAPNFRLTDQNGHSITLAAFRGRPVIITFVDPLCRNLCPLAAHVLNQVDASMPASERPAIIAVSVDIYADKRADLMQDFQKWDLVPQWHWAVGNPKQLAAVWKAYKVGVLVTTKRIAGTTVHYITHDEIAYVIDPNGDERGLFVYPYYPPDFEHFIERVGQPATA